MDDINMYHKFAAGALATPLPLINGYPLLIPREPLTPAANAVTIRILAARASLCKHEDSITTAYKLGPGELMLRGWTLFFTLGKVIERPYRCVSHDLPTSAKNRFAYIRRLVDASLAAVPDEMSSSSRQFLAHELSTFYTRAELYSIAKTNDPAALAAFLGEMKFKNEKDYVAKQGIVDRFLGDFIVYHMQKIEAVNDARRKMEKARKKQRRLRNARVRARTANSLERILDVNGRKLVRTAIKEDEFLEKYLKVYYQELA